MTPTVCTFCDATGHSLPCEVRRRALWTPLSGTELLMLRRSPWFLGICKSFGCSSVERFVSGTSSQVSDGLLYAHLRHNALDRLACQTTATAGRHHKFLLCAGLNFPSQR
ncbi:hypothetical protein BDP55DRAFT_687434 [Colletotrichum godetiae]|uniref:Uncharacterized protein n=1 Tax=Colletotrichum godetiae TaxID=1209918 RepID=A0AAJ0EPT3_9PEZI|nr:uncharacterized protein BDP55DRAFT_687434 [Colletotrichum godetiae]KAK1656929.1 hypothetical protein BDP55DRAFT_687434 [Colletotrichum godetiae]